MCSSHVRYFLELKVILSKSELVPTFKLPSSPNHMWSGAAVDRKSAEVVNYLLKTWKVRPGPPWCAGKLSYQARKMHARICYEYTQATKITIQGNDEYRISKRKTWHWHFYRQFIHQTQQLPLNPIVLGYVPCRMVRCVCQQQFPLPKAEHFA